MLHIKAQRTECHLAFQLLPHEAIFSKLRQDDFQPGILHPADPSGKPKISLAAYSREVEDMKLLLSLGRRRRRMLTQLQGKRLGWEGGRNGAELQHAE